MITDDEVMRLFERADPARTTDDLDDTPDATGYLAALRQRSNDVTYIQPTENPTARPQRRRLAMIAAAAAAVLVVVALVFTARGDDEGQEVPATVPPTRPATIPASTIPTSRTPTPTPAPVVVDGPVAQAEAFLAAIETGDPAAVEALQAPDFESRQWMGPIHQAASGAAYVDPSCNVSGDPGQLTIVVCTTSITLDAHRLTNTGGAPISLTVTVGDAGVTAMDVSVNNLGLLPFEGWKEVNWPGELPIEVDEITTVEGVVEYARIEEQLAEEWAAAAVEAVDSSFADFNAGDVDGFAVRFDSVGKFAPREVVAALVAQGQQYLVSGCAVDGIEPAGLTVVCDLVVRHGSFETSGVEADGDISLTLSSQGEITRVTTDIELGPIDEFDSAFEQWLLITDPDVHGQITWIEVGEHRIPGADDQALVAPYYEEFGADWS